MWDCLLVMIYMRVYMQFSAWKCFCRIHVVVCGMVHSLKLKFNPWCSTIHYVRSVLLEEMLRSFHISHITQQQESSMTGRFKWGKTENAPTRTSIWGKFTNKFSCTVRRTELWQFSASHATGMRRNTVIEHKSFWRKESDICVCCI